MATIGIMDSGVGGLSVLRELLRTLPEHNYVYYADSANCPYGPKTHEWVSRRVQEIVEILLAKGADIIVLACNTATAAAVTDLRARWPEIPFVGIEPAVKPAAQSTVSGVIGVLATKGTLNGEKYRNTREKYASAVKVAEHVGEGFVELVEHEILDGPQAEAVVEASLRPLLDAGADRIVLGCTHYPFLLPVFRKLAPAGVEFLDPAPAIARRVADIIAANGLAGTGTKKEQRSVALLSSSDGSSLERLYESIL